MPLRLIALLAVTAALAAATSVGAATSTLRIVHRGQLVTLTVATPSHGYCLAHIIYPGAVEQDSAVSSPVDGKVTWRVRIPSRAGLGVASWLARCGVLWSRSGNWRVARA